MHVYVHTHACTHTCMFVCIFIFSYDIYHWAQQGKWFSESTWLASGAGRTRTKCLYPRTKEEVLPGKQQVHTSALLFCAGCPQHPRHVWGTHAGPVLFGNRVSFCELEGKSTTRFSQLPLLLGEAICFARRKKQWLLSIAELNKTQAVLSLTLMKPL